jgi:hypothetical protein
VLYISRSNVRSIARITSTIPFLSRSHGDRAKAKMGGGAVATFNIIIFFSINAIILLDLAGVRSSNIT